MGMPLRTIAAFVVAAGLGIGTLADERPARALIRSGEFWILAGDFHVHAFPGDGSLTSAALRDEAVRAGLDVIAITNHNQTFTGRLGSWMARHSAGPLVIGSEEVTHPEYHLVAVGIARGVSADQSAVDAIAAIHAQGGVAIAAQPGPAFPGYDDAAFAVVDGTEVAHPTSRDDWQRTFVAEFERARRLNPRVAPIGSSDIHVTPALGSCRTFLFVRERTAAGVLDAIREGRTVARDDAGTLYGEPALVERVRVAMPAGRSYPHEAWRRLSVVLTWIGAAGMVLCGGPARRRDLNFPSNFP